MPLTSVLIMTRLERKVLELSDILKILQDSLRIDDDNT